MKEGDVWDVAEMYPEWFWFTAQSYLAWGMRCTPQGSFEPQRPSWIKGIFIPLPSPTCLLVYLVIQLVQVWVDPEKWIEVGKGNRISLVPLLPYCPFQLSHLCPIPPPPCPFGDMDRLLAHRHVYLLLARVVRPCCIACCLCNSRKGPYTANLTV